MGLNPEEMSRIWWKGALKSALKGIPQGLMLGIGGACLLFSTIALLGGIGATAGLALGISQAFGGFLYSAATTATLATATAVPAFSLASINILPIVALNTVLTVVGNFITGGDMAVNTYKQDMEHKINEARLARLESHEIAPQQEAARPLSASLRRILAQGSCKPGAKIDAEQYRPDKIPIGRAIN